LFVARGKLLRAAIGADAVSIVIERERFGIV
jgi:hypothetical protein